MLKFTFVGFDVKQWPWSGPFNVDDTGWDLNEEVAEALKTEFSIQENEYQLLMPKSSSQMEKISAYISTLPNANIAAIEIPAFLAELKDKRTGYKTATNNIELKNYIFRGFDVSDIDGFFSGLHCPEIGKNDGGLFSPNDYLCALEASVFLNFIDREHLPFSVTKVLTLK